MILKRESVHPKPTNAFAEWDEGQRDPEAFVLSLYFLPCLLPKTEPEAGLDPKTRACFSTRLSVSP